MKTPKKVHYANRFLCDTACNLFFLVSARSAPKTTFDKREVTCKLCKRTKIFKERR